MRRAIVLFVVLAASTPALADVSCAPVDSTARILKSPSPNDVHPDWAGESTVGLSWSFAPVGKPIANASGEYLKGRLISPRGGEVNRGVYIIRREWDCQ